MIYFLDSGRNKENMYNTYNVSGMTVCRIGRYKILRRVFFFLLFFSGRGRLFYRKFLTENAMSDFFFVALWILIIDALRTRYSDYRIIVSVIMRGKNGNVYSQ